MAATFASEHLRRPWTAAEGIAGESAGGACRMTTVHIATRLCDDATILDLEGRLILGSATDSLGNRLQEVISKGSRKLLLNMKGVTQVDTTGISTIVRAFVSMQRAGGKLALFHLTDRVRMILDMTRLLNVIPNYSDEAEALARLR
jgi:anti-anti-sigma factor